MSLLLIWMNHLDDGVLVEISYAKIIGKPVVGFRTDKRSPFGNITHELDGIHFFPAFQCDVFIKHDMSCKIDDEFKTLANIIHSEIGKLNYYTDSRSNETTTTVTDDIKNIADILFKNIENLNSIDSIKEVVNRYKDNKDKIDKIKPLIIDHSK